MTTQNLYETITVPLQDGSTVELRPANIRQLKAGQASLQRLSDAKDTDETLDVLLETCIGLLKKQKPELADPEDGKELAEDVFDMDTIYKVIEVMLGVKLNDPKLQEAAMRVMAEQG